MRNNIIAIVAISFATVGALWGIGNLINPAPEVDLPVEDIVLMAERSTFNGTNPDVHVQINVPTKLVVRNNDALTHDVRVDVATKNGITPINTAPVRDGQDFITPIVASKHVM